MLCKQKTLDFQRFLFYIVKLSQEQLPQVGLLGLNL